MKDILVSVIIPVYNVDAYLQECIESARRQTHTNLEIILVDDGSTDSSGEICDQAAQQDSRIRVIHKPNGGVSSARNAGIDVAGGAYICFLDSDDVYLPDCVSCLLDACIRRKTPVAIGDYISFEEAAPTEGKNLHQETLYSREESLKHIIGKDHITFTIPSNKLFARSILEACRYTEGIIHEDEEFIYRVLDTAGKAVYVRKEIYGYRTRPESIMTADYSPKRMIFLKIARDRALFFREKGEEELYFQFQWVYAAALLQHYPEVKKKLKKPEIAAQILAEFRRVAPELLETPMLSQKKKLVIRVFSQIPGQFNRAMWLKQKVYR